MRRHAAQIHSVSAVSPREKRKYLRPRPWRSFLPGIGSARSAPMKNNDDIPSTNTNEIKHLINRVKQGEIDRGDAQLIEKLLNILLTIVSLLQRKRTSIRRMSSCLESRRKSWARTSLKHSRGEPVRGWCKFSDRFAERVVLEVNLRGRFISSRSNETETPRTLSNGSLGLSRS